MTARRWAIVDREDVPNTAATLTGQFHRPPLEPVPGLERLTTVSPEEYLEVPSLFQKTALLAGVLDRLVGPAAETEEER